MPLVLSDQSSMPPAGAADNEVVAGPETTVVGMAGTEGAPGASATLGSVFGLTLYVGTVIAESVVSNLALLGM